MATKPKIDSSGQTAAELAEQVGLAQEDIMAQDQDQNPDTMIGGALMNRPVLSPTPVAPVSPSQPVGATQPAGTTPTTPQTAMGIPEAEARKEWEKNGMDATGWQKNPDGTWTAPVSTSTDRPTFKSEDEIRNEELKRAQEMINATEALFGDQLADVERRGQEALQQSQSSSVSAGLAGSPFMDAQSRGVTQQTDRAKQSVRAERSAQVAAITAAAQGRATDRFEREQARYRDERDFAVSERDKQLQEQKDQATAAKARVVDTIKSLAQGGVSLSELDAQEYQFMLEDAGMSEFEAHSLWASNTPAANASYSVQNGFLVTTYFDPVTQKPVIKSEKLPSEQAQGSYTTKEMKDGSLLFIPDNIDPSIPIEEQILFGGNFADPESNKPVAVGGYLVNPDTGEIVFASPTGAKTYTLSPGQSVFDEAGNVIAMNPNDASAEKPVVLNPGDTAYNADGSVFAKVPFSDDPVKNAQMEDREEKKKADLKSKEGALLQQEETSNTVNSAITKLVGTDTEEGLIQKTNAYGRAWLSWLPASKARTVEATVDTIKASLGKDTLQQMREISSSGASGFGALSEKELALLQENVANLDVGLDSETLIENLKAVATHYDKWLEYTKKGMEASAQETGGSASTPQEGDFIDKDGNTWRDDGTGNYEQVPKADGGDTTIKTISLGGRTVKASGTVVNRLAMANRDFKNATGKEIIVNEGHRTRERQAELYRRSQAGEIGRAAPPGSSFHETGNAIDVANWKEAEKYLRKYGLVNDLHDDRNHFSYGETNAIT